MTDEALLTVSVDFDGTITQSSDPNTLGFNALRPDCEAVMWSLYYLGVRFRLLTGRRDEWTPEAVRLCKHWNLPIDTSTPNRKMISDVYIDDKNLGCTGIDWRMIYDMLSCRVLSIKSKKKEEARQ